MALDDAALEELRARADAAEAAAEATRVELETAREECARLTAHGASLEKAACAAAATAEEARAQAADAASKAEARSAATETELRAAIDAATSRADGFKAALAEKSAECAFYTLVPIRRRLRGERRS